MKNLHELKRGYTVVMDGFIADLIVDITYRNPRYDIYNIVNELRHFFKYLHKYGIYFDKYIDCWLYVENEFEQCDYYTRKLFKGVRPCYHSHILLKGIKPSLSQALQKACSERFGVSVVEPYDHTRVGNTRNEYIAEKCARYNTIGWFSFRVNNSLRKPPRFYYKHVKYRDKLTGKPKSIRKYATKQLLKG